jgi:hypothetical protein
MADDFTMDHAFSSMALSTLLRELVMGDIIADIIADEEHALSSHEDSSIVHSSGEQQATW